MFNHLHVHSTYSFLDGLALPEELAQKAKEQNNTALAITDHGNVSAHKAIEEACSENEIKPIFGCELYVRDSRSVKTKERYHITALAKTEKGYKNLLKLVSIG